MQIVTYWVFCSQGMIYLLYLSISVPVHERKLQILNKYLGDKYWGREREGGTQIKDSCLMDDTI